MGFQLGRKAAFIVAVLVLVCFCFAEANAQRRRTKKSRRVTNPVTKTAATPAPTPSSSTSEPRIISTADETDTGATTSNTRGRRNTTPEYDEDGTRQKVDRLSAQFNTMNEKLSQMEQQQRTLVDLERLTRAETRAENLRAQLRDVQTKESDLQARAEQIEYELQPSVIERTLAVNGSTRPEDLRELRRRQLESEKSRVQNQLNQLATNRARLESAVANADAEADRIRARVDAPPVTGRPETTSTDAGAPPADPSQQNDGGAEP